MNPHYIPEYICPKCKCQRLKRIPNEWDAKGNASEFFPGWTFCTECGTHTYMRELVPKEVA